jgi:hypothetical protein
VIRAEAEPPRRLSGRAARVVITAAVLAMLVLIALPYMAPSSDARTALAWGSELAHGRSPDFNGLLLPIKHPLTIGVGVVLSPLTPHAALAAYSALWVLAFASLAYAVYRLVRSAGGWGLAIVAALLVVVRPKIAFYGSEAVEDIPFAAAILLAAALIAEGPQRNWRPVLILLTLAGLMRPEVWALAIGYAAWFATRPGPSGRERALAIGLAIAAPVLWIGFDWAVTGDPLQTYHYARLAKQPSRLAAGYQARPATTHFGWIPGAIRLAIVRRGVMGTIGWPLAIGGTVAALVVLWQGRFGLRNRRVAVEDRGPLLTAAVGLGGIALFIVLFVVSLPSVDRYLLVSAIALAALVSTAAARSDRSRALFVAAVIGLGGALATAPFYLADLGDVLVAQHHRHAEQQHLQSLLSRPAVGRALAACPRLAVGGPVPDFAQGARGAAAQTFDRDPASIELKRWAAVGPGRSVLRRKWRSPTRSGTVVREGEWTFASAC